MPGWSAYITRIHKAPPHIDAPDVGVFLYRTRDGVYVTADAALQAAITLHTTSTRYHTAPNVAMINRLAARDVEMVHALHDAGMTIVFTDYILLYTVAEIQLFYTNTPIQLGFVF